MIRLPFLVISLALIFGSMPQTTAQDTEAFIGDHVCINRVLTQPTERVVSSIYPEVSEDGQYVVHQDRTNAGNNVLYSTPLDGSTGQVEIFSKPHADYGTVQAEAFAGTSPFVLVSATASSTNNKTFYVVPLDGSASATPYNADKTITDVLRISGTNDIFFITDNDEIYRDSIPSTGNPTLIAAHSMPSTTLSTDNFVFTSTRLLYRVAYDHNAAPDVFEQMTDLYSVPLDGSAPAVLLAMDTYINDVMLDPTSTQVIYSMSDQSVFIRNVDGTDSPLYLFTGDYSLMPDEPYLVMLTATEVIVHHIDGVTPPVIIAHNLMQNYNFIELEDIGPDVIFINGFKIPFDSMIYQLNWQDSTVLTPITTLTDPERSIGRFRLTPNGEHIAFDTRYLNNIFGDLSPYALYMRPVDGSELPVRVSAPVDETFPGFNTVYLEYLSDNWLVFIDEEGLKSVAVGGSGPITTLAEGSGLSTTRSALDDRAMIYVDSQENPPGAYIQLIEGGEATRVNRPTGIPSPMQLTPDQQYIVYSAYDPEIGLYPRLFSTQCTELGPREVFPATNLTATDITATPDDVQLTWTHNTTEATVQNVQAEGYRVQLRDGETVLYDAALALDDACVDVLCSHAVPMQLWEKNGPFVAAIMGEREGDITTESAVPISVNVPAPTTVTIDETTGVDTLQPTLYWNASDTNASHFHIYVGPSNNLANPAYFDWVSRTNTCADSGLGNACSFMLPVKLAHQTEYQIWIQTAGPGGTDTDWAGPQTFTVDLDLPLPPQNITVDPRDGRPSISWDADGNALWVQLYIGGDGNVHLNWYDLTDACTEATCTLYPAIDWVGTGNPLQVWMQAWGPAGFSSPDGTNSVESWIQGPNLTLPTTAPNTPTGLTVIGGDTVEFAYQWDAMTNATWYEIVLEPGNWHYSVWVNADDIGCDGTCSYSDPNLAGGVLDLSAGTDTYTFRMRAWGPGGFADYSADVMFDYTYTAP